MNIESLKLFKEVASRRSISKVADSTHFSQPAISQQIKRLEEYLGYSLFTRSNKGVQLTEAGVVVNRYANSIILAYENMLEDLSVIEDSFNIIRLNCTPIIANYALPCTVYSINNSNKMNTTTPLKMELYTNHSEEVEINIANGTFDLGIVISKPNHKYLTADLLATDTIIPVIAAKYKLDQNVTVKELVQEDLILPSDRFRIRESIRNWFLEVGYELDNLKISSNMDEIESIKSTVVKGYGVTFLPYLTIKKELYTEQLRRIHVEGFELYYDIYLIYNENRLHEASFREFIKMFKSRARKTFC